MLLRNISYMVPLLWLVYTRIFHYLGRFVGGWLHTLDHIPFTEYLCMWVLLSLVSLFRYLGWRGETHAWCTIFHCLGNLIGTQVYMHPIRSNSPVNLLTEFIYLLNYGIIQCLHRCFHMFGPLLWGRDLWIRLCHLVGQSVSQFVIPVIFS